MFVPKNKTLEVAFLAVMTPFVTVLTYMFIFPIPETHGYFNFGEVGIYIAAALFGPIVGAFAGGVGSMIADIISGYIIYAPATLIIKGTEGLIVGYLVRKLRTINVTQQQIASGAGAVLLSGMVISVWYWTILPLWIWIIYGLLIITLVIFSLMKIEREELPLVISMVLGGMVMISGYFIYEQFYLGYPAIFELPFNIMQMVGGIIISIPVIKIVKFAITSMGISFEVIGEE
ncbi:MAG: ECF transporter S component [Candidatus Asgardarchaeia archaeon]